MIELPESITLGRQIHETLTGKTITDVFNTNSPHKFTFFYGDPLSYKQLLINKKILSAQGYGIFVDIILENNIRISFNDDITVYYGTQASQIPAKYQLLLTFDDESFLAFTVAMYGGIAVYEGKFDNTYYTKSIESISPLSDAFDMTYFENLIGHEVKNISLKALLATGQRIPGIGNGTLQDILFNASLNPRRKLFSLSSHEKKNLYHSIKETLSAMLERAGRNTENNLYGKGGYKTLMSKNTYNTPCPQCGGSITKENYLGGTVYYCPQCQPNI